LPRKPETQELGALLDSSLRAARLRRFAFLGGESLTRSCAHLPASTRARFGLDRARGCVVAALAYGEGPPDPPRWAMDWLEAHDERRLARLARFARANWYSEISDRLKDTAARTRAALKAAGREPGSGRDWRHLSNSGLPEKALALESGLGRLGRQTLVMIPGAGPACVLGLLLLPFDPVLGLSGAEPDSGPARHVPGEDCGECQACVEACPTRALEPDGRYHRERCLQHWSAIPGPLPSFIEEAWGDRLYGCDLCIEACPGFARPGFAGGTGTDLDGLGTGPEERTDRGLLGPGLPAAWLAEAPEEEIRGRLRGSAIGMKWMGIEAFRRNARLALDDEGYAIGAATVREDLDCDEKSVKAGGTLRAGRRGPSHRALP
jgi:epoxyqueuosine reductase QueG